MFLSKLQNEINQWRNNVYKGVMPETENILRYVKHVGFLHSPQLEAFETYIYLKEIKNNIPTRKVFENLYSNEKELLIEGLGVSKDKAFDYIGNSKKIEDLITTRFPSLDYSSQLYALTMGTGKTLLMGIMMIYDFILSFRHPSDKRFAKNALIFAPDKTIIESLKEIKNFDYLRIFPREYSEILLNIKYHYLEDVRTNLALIGNYNVIVSNSQKIILKTRRKSEIASRQLLLDNAFLEKKEIENMRLRSLRGLQDLIVLVDEAHHAFGNNLEGELKKVKQTINYLHNEGKTDLISMISLTGTPYVNGNMIDEVVYYFGLKEGIEQGILKQVSILNYGNVKNQIFIDDVLEVFFSNYSTKLDGRLPKIVFYAPTIDELQQELRPMIENSLLNNGKDINVVLEYHTEAEYNKSEFLNLDTPECQKQIVLLVGKGTEGWNCKSLVATALFRKPKSPVFVLQSTTRCLRSIGDNSVKARIFLSNENFKILDGELKNSFNTSITDINNQNQNKVEHNLQIVKRKTLKIKKKIKELIANKCNDLCYIRIDSTKFINRNELCIEENLITLDGNIATYNKGKRRDICVNNDFTFYEIIERINRHTHLNCLDIKKILENSNIGREELVAKINIDENFLTYIINEILCKVFSYEVQTTIQEEEIELTKCYPFKISIDSNKNKLVVYKNGKRGHKLGFHINPYNFDSEDEKNLFTILQNEFVDNEAIREIYFVGGVCNTAHNDFYFEYYNPEHKNISKYFPDFLIETSKGRYLVVEVKDARSKSTYEENKKHYNGKTETIFDEVFSKEIGFNEFRECNKNFDYKIIFDAKLQQQQKKLIKMIGDM